jgi:integrase
LFRGGALSGATWGRPTRQPLTPRRLGKFPAEASLDLWWLAALSGLRCGELCGLT